MQKRFAGVHRNGRASRDRAVLECLSGIEFRLACSVPYLADLLDSEEEDVVLGTLAYIRRWKLVAMKDDVLRLAESRASSRDVQGAARRTLEGLAQLAPTIGRRSRRAERARRAG
ncbi:MAG: hypothetical protein AB7T63_13435 [Planctomycetota bacterium]